MKASEYVKQNGWAMAIKAVAECTYGYGIDLTELKRLVESHELVGKMGGVEKSKLRVQGNRLSYKRSAMLSKAITDVESCYD